jgi:hypothetical protein
LDDKYKLMMLLVSLYGCPFIVYKNLIHLCPLRARQTIRRQFGGTGFKEFFPNYVLLEAFECTP